MVAMLYGLVGVAVLEFVVQAALLLAGCFLVATGITGGLMWFGDKYGNIKLTAVCFALSFGLICLLLAIQQ